MKTTMYKRVFLVSIVFLSLLGTSSCEKENLTEIQMNVSGKFVMLQKSEWFTSYGKTVKAFFYEEQEGSESYPIERCITGYIPSDYRSHDTINIKATLVLVAPKGAQLAVDLPNRQPEVYKLKNIEKI